MSQHSAIDKLRDAISDFGKNHPDRVGYFVKGQRIIQQGDMSADCFLIKEGVVSILVRDHGSPVEKQVALRFDGDLIGEIAFLQRNSPRTASVKVESENAVLIRINRDDIFSIIRKDPDVGDVISLIKQLASPRINETNQVVKGEISVESAIISVIVADIHNFSTVGEAVWEEHLNAFLFEFIEHVDDLVSQHDGYFEDQGDGFKAVFRGGQHAIRAITCATQIIDHFPDLRSHWAQVNDGFSNLGLGMGVCTDFMSVRARLTSGVQKQRVYSHAINIAAAMAKYKTVVTDVEIYLDNSTASFLKDLGLKFEGPMQRWLEKLGKIYPVYRVIDYPGGSELEMGHEGLASLKDNGATSPAISPQRVPVFISYAHVDNENDDKDKRYLDRLLEQLRPLSLQDQVCAWSDKDLQIGANWHETIQESLVNAKAVVLLVSPAFLASDYIRSSELPILLRNAKEKGVVVLPIVLRPCLFTQTRFKYPDPVLGPEEFSLASLQAANSPTKPLNSLAEHEQDKVLLSVAERLLSLVRA